MRMAAICISFQHGSGRDETFFNYLNKDSTYQVSIGCQSQFLNVLPAFAYLILITILRQVVYYPISIDEKTEAGKMEVICLRSFRQLMIELVVRPSKSIPELATTLQTQQSLGQRYISEKKKNKWTGSLLLFLIPFLKT